MYFVIAFSEKYTRCAQGLINAINHYHDAEIIAYVDDIDNEAVRSIARSYANLHLIEFVPNEWSYGNWHPLIWSKIDAFSLDISEPCVFLDVDILMYKPLDSYLERYQRSGKIIGGAMDDDSLADQFKGAWGTQLLGKTDSGSAFNAGAMIFTPNRSSFEDLRELAEKNHEKVAFPEQAILNLWALQNGGWLDLGHEFMALPFSEKVIGSEEYALLHFFTPRPEFMTKHGEREGESSFSEALIEFKRRFGVKPG